MHADFPPLLLPHARNGSRPISQLQEGLTEAVPAPPSSVRADVLCRVRRTLQHFLLKWMASQHTWAGRFCTKKCIGLISAMTDGHSAKLSTQGLGFPMRRTNLCKTWAHTFVVPITQCAENFQNPREKVEDFRFYFGFQSQLWNTQNVHVEQKFPCNFMVACQEFLVWLFLNRRWMLGSTLKGNVAEPLELAPLLLLTMAKAPPQKLELLDAAPLERKQPLWQSLLCYQIKHFILGLLPSYIISYPLK